LRAVEGDVFTEAVAAYMDVIRDRATVELNRNNVRVLETNLQAARDRFEIGDVTRTDVAQSEARLALAQSRLTLAEGRLTGSEQNYRRVIGRQPGALQPPPPLPPFPATADEAVRIALSNNPDLIAITRQAEAAGYDVKSVRGTRLPTVSAVASGDYFDATGDDFGLQSGTATSIGAQARVPLYQGGLPAPASARRRRSRGRPWSSASPPSARWSPTTRSAFADYQAAISAIKSNEVAVRPTSWRWKAPRPRTASAPAPSSTCSMPSRSCSTRRCCW
jgi:outer membrane protein